MTDLDHKYQLLKNNLCSQESLAIAFSGGVDSTFLLDTAAEVLGNKVIAVTASSCFFPKKELEDTVEFCRERHIRHIIIESDVLNIPGVRQNPPDRCYLCKKDLFRKILRAAGSNQIRAVAEGSNMDDCGDYRPGMRAIRELGINSPLLEAGLTKEEIRVLSRRRNLPTWEKPSFACLASRFVYGEELSPEKLAMVEEAEQFLLKLGFRQIRVRIHGTLARIETEPGDASRLISPSLAPKIHEKLKSIGFSYVTLDLQGYRTGSMNEIL